jgi:hypothetical protein
MYGIKETKALGKPFVSIINQIIKLMSGESSIILKFRKHISTVQSPFMVKF